MVKTQREMEMEQEMKQKETIRRRGRRRPLPTEEDEEEQQRWDQMMMMMMMMSMAVGMIHQSIEVEEIDCVSCVLLETLTTVNVLDSEFGICGSMVVVRLDGEEAYV